MKRFAAHYIFLGKDKIYKQSYLQLENNNCISGVYPLSDEIEGTVFCNGILFPVLEQMKFSSSDILTILIKLSETYPQDSIFQLMGHFGIVSEEQNLPVQIFQIDGIDLLTLNITPTNSVLNVIVRSLH